MGLINQPSSLLTELADLRRQIAELRKRSAAPVAVVAVPFAPARAQDLPTVTAADFETVWQATVPVWCPALLLTTVDGCDVGTAGEGQLVLTDSAGTRTVGWTCGEGLTRTVRGPFSLTDGEVQLSVQYRRTTGSGVLRAQISDARQQR
ncbi:hypothetical protein [Kutzneria sp. NPDC052558]|uniref:hypothetical protein n=1 Tax=Kutzneria sp. NPDC052558 TaxID=3364121 RepID=UPI0037C81D90